MNKLLFLIVLLIQGATFPLRAQNQDVTGPGDLIYAGQMIGGAFVVATEGTPVGNANMFPSNGKPTFAIDDNNTTEYRNFGEINTGLVIRVGSNFNGGGTLLTQLGFGTGSDAPERDPLTFTLEGTNGNPLTGIYTFITTSSTGLNTDPGRERGALSAPLPAVGAFTSYRVIFPTVRDSGLADSMQIGEITLRGVAAPEPTPLTLLGLPVLGLLGTRRQRRAEA